MSQKIQTITKFIMSLVLKFTCKNCNYSEMIEKNTQETNCIYRNEVKLGQSGMKIDPMIIDDPTYSRTRNVSCPECYYREAIFFQNPNNNDSGIFFNAS